MSADKVWVRTFKTGYKQVTLSQQPFDPAPCGYDDTEYTRTDLSQASVAAALEAAAAKLQNVADNWDCGHNESRLCDCAPYVEQWGLAADEIRALITDHDRDALAAHVAAEVAKARAEDAAWLQSFDSADWFWRQMDPDDNADNPAEVIHRAYLGQFTICEIASSYRGPTRFGFNAPVLDPESDDEEFLHFETREYAMEAAKARQAHLAQIGAKP